MHYSTLTDNLTMFHAHRENPLLFRRRSMTTTLWLKFQLWKLDLRARFRR